MNKDAGEHRGRPREFDRLIVGGFLAVSMAAVLVIVSLQQLTIALKISVVSFAITIPYWGIMLATFTFHESYGIRNPPKSYWGENEFIIILTLVGIASIFFHIWDVAGIIFVVCGLYFWWRSWRYYERTLEDRM